MHLSTIILTVTPLLTATTALSIPFSEYISLRAHVLLKKSLLADPPLPASALPPPPGTLKYIALGVGTQNYTCATSTSSSIPVAIGAVATLSNIRTLVQVNPASVPSIPVLALKTAELTGTNAQNLPTLGKHFFNAAGKPTFDLTGGSPPARLTAKKVAAVPAPAGSYAGAQNEGAVPWLYLTDSGQGLSFGGITDVYRVETAGGAAPANCAGMAGAFEVQYAAEYWFYGP